MYRVKKKRKKKEEEEKECEPMPVLETALAALQPLPPRLAEPDTLPGHTPVRADLLELGEHLGVHDGLVGALIGLRGHRGQLGVQQVARALNQRQHTAPLARRRRRRLLRRRDG